MMLEDVCRECRNWFDRGQPKIFADKITILDGKIQDSDFLARIQEGQYFRIVGSVFNDGVHQYSESLELTDEVFKGALWLMAVPQAFLSLVQSIEAWSAKYGAVDSEAMSPFNSESFGGYSYTKSAGGSSDGQSAGASWTGVFGASLNRWRKI